MLDRDYKRVRYRTNVIQNKSKNRTDHKGRQCHIPMDTKTIEKPVRQCHDALARKIRVGELILFGSYLEGNVTVCSGIDVIVVSDDFKRLTEDERLNILESAAGSIEPDIDPWGFTHEELVRASERTALSNYSKGF